MSKSKRVNKQAVVDAAVAFYAADLQVLARAKALEQVTRSATAETDDTSALQSMMTAMEYRAIARARLFEVVSGED